ncbi:MAG: hypothetical protein WCW35_00890 [Bacteroidota bacterium]
MKKSLNAIILFGLLFIGLTIIGCNESSNSAAGGSGGPLFKTAGTFNFSSNRGSISANGIFDTLYTAQNAAGAFRFKSGNANIYVVFAYNAISQSEVQVAFVGVADTVNAIANGSYPFVSTTANKRAFFGYFPNAADSTASNEFYGLINGSVTISAVSATQVTGTFLGSGYDQNSQANPQTIDVTGGTFNSPVVEQAIDLSGDTNEPVQHWIKRAILKDRSVKIF